MRASHVRCSPRLLLFAAACVAVAWVGSCTLDRVGAGPETTATGGGSTSTGGSAPTTSSTTDLWPTTTTTTGGGGQGGSGGLPAGGAGGAGGATTTTTTTGTGTLELGKPCTQDDECQSNACSFEDGTGICCDEECTALCHSCFAADTEASDGTCAPITKGEDPYLECPADQWCGGDGVCRRQDGESCGAGTDCLSGFCPLQDLVCCNEACDGSCEGCLGAETYSSTGTCGYIFHTWDPENECDGNDHCDGSGSCH